ncbi:MAG TPA: MptD family putative ECF transporter S component [Cellulomonas sp.]
MSGTAPAVRTAAPRDRLRGRDFINIGIFSAIYFVLNFVFMLAGGIHPIMWILMPALIALTTGIPFLLMCVRVPKPGAVIVMGLITGIIYFATGMFTPLIIGMMAASCVVAEAVRWGTRYLSFAGNTAAFAVFSLGMCGSPLPLWVFRDSFLTQIADQGMSADYLASLEALSGTGTLVLMFAATIVLAVVGAVIAKKMFSKHLERAGLA